MNALRAIPLPLRIAGLFFAGLVLFQLIGKVPREVFVSCAVVFWLLVLVTWAYDQGWLNPLARVAVVSHLLGFLSNRAALAGGGAKGPAKTDASPAGELDDAERQRLYATAQEDMARLRGNDIGKDLIGQRIVAPARDNTDNPFGSNADAAIILIAGPRGVGKTTLARAVSNLLTGVGALKTAKIVTVRPTDLRAGEFGSAIELARSKVRSARGGTLFLDDADWLLAADPYGSSDTPGSDFGLTLGEAVSEYRQEVLVIATFSPEGLEQLKSDVQHAKWLGKLARREIVLDNMDDDALLNILEEELEATGWRFESDTSRTAARRMIADLRDRKAPHFDNAIACRRVAETLADFTADVSDDLARRQLIGLEAVRIADEEMD